MGKNLAFLAFLIALSGNAQKKYWQQQADYKMEVNVDVKNYTYQAQQTITYTNNSPDTLKVVFYHLYLNAFQPNSEMDIRLQTIVDPDGRMTNNLGTKENPIFESRIASLKENQQGYIQVVSLEQDSKSVSYEVIGTILKVNLHSPILPNAQTTFQMNYKAQIPEMIRRTGRNSNDGIALSMTQWFPKIVEYDDAGWHANQYVSREFHGVWGNFDVKITIDKNYIIAGTGVLQNPKEIGLGYIPKGKKNSQNQRKYTYLAF